MLAYYYTPLKKTEGLEIYRGSNYPQRGMPGKYLFVFVQQEGAGAASINWRVAAVAMWPTCGAVLALRCQGVKCQAFPKISA
jgi:hypothetical protein